MTSYADEKRQAVSRWFSNGRPVVCHYCGVPLSRDSVTVDHKIAKSRDGGYARGNLLPCCLDCNNEKGNADYESFKAWKLPEKQARLNGTDVPDLPEFPKVKPRIIGGENLFPKHFRVLEILSKPGAYALPSGRIPFRFLDGRMGSLSGEVALTLEQKGRIERSGAQKKKKGVVFVWRITESGREIIT